MAMASRERMNNPPSVRYRVLYNQDCTNLFAVTKEPLTPAHVDRMVDEVADGGADLMLINPNAQRVCYPSRAWQTFWDGYAPGRREFFGPVPEKEIPGRDAWVAQMKRLADQGCDYLARALARCRARGIAPGVSIRMNDMHDAPTPGTHLFGRFYMEHPECRLDPPIPGAGWAARGLDFAHPAVRDHVLALVRELAAGYDFDVLELDFLRFHCYFQPGRPVEHAALMTGLLRDIRVILDATGRPISLIPRVGAAPASALKLGFDVAAWAREDLIQGVTAAAFLVTQWNLAVAAFKALVGDRVAVYAGMEYVADRRPDLPVRYMPVDPALMRGFAAGHLAAGADGLHVFNFFCAREEAWGKTREPVFAMLRELRDPECLRGREKTVTLTSGWIVAATDGPLQVPAALGTEPRAFEFLMTAESAEMRAEAVVMIAGGDAGACGRLGLQVNGVQAGAAVLVEPAGVKDYRRVLFAVPVSALRDGRNTLVLRNTGAAVTVVSMDVRVTCA